MPCAATYWYILLYIPPCSVVRLRCSSWYVVRGIVLYRLVGSYIVLLVVLSLVLSVVYRCRSWLLLLLLIASLIVLSVVPVSRSLSVACRACPCGLVASLLAVATTAPRGYRQAVRLATLRRGGIFQKGGRGRPKPAPSPFLCTRSKKM